MTTGQEIYNLGVKHVGEKYVFGVVVPKNDKEWDGPWDCAEFASWLVYQLTGRLYGCANNNGDPAGADAYSGFWATDANRIGKKITVEDAARTPGAALVRIAGSGLIGHVAISNGHGGTVEAHSTKTGVITSKISGRRWDYGVLVPWIDYKKEAAVPPSVPGPGKIYRWTKPMQHGEKIKEIQRALGIKADGWYGPKTALAVKTFQIKASLVADGEVGPDTAAKLGLTI